MHKTCHAADGTTLALCVQDACQEADGMVLAKEIGDPPTQRGGGPPWPLASLAGDPP